MQREVIACLLAVVPAAPAAPEMFPSLELVPTFRRSGPSRTSRPLEVGPSKSDRRSTTVSLHLFLSDLIYCAFEICFPDVFAPVFSEMLRRLGREERSVWWDLSPGQSGHMWFLRSTLQPPKHRSATLFHPPLRLPRLLSAALFSLAIPPNRCPPTTAWNE